MRKITCVLLLLLGLNFLLAPLPVNAASEAEYQAKIQALQSRNTQLEKKLEETTADLQRSTDTVKVLKKQMAEITTASEDNVKEVNDTRAAMKEVKAQLKTLLEQQKETTTGKVSAEDLAKAVQRAQQFEKDLKKATAELEDHKKTIERLKKTPAASGSEDLKKKLEEVQADLQKQQKQFKATVELLQDRESELKEAQTAIQTLKKQISAGPLKSADQSESRLTELEATLADVNAKLIKMAQAKSALDAQVKELQAKQQDRAKDTELARKDAEIAQKAAEITRLEGEVRKAADYINNRDAEIAAITKSKTEAETQLATQAKVKAETETQLTQLATSKTDLAAQLTALAKAKTDLEAQLTERSAALAKAKTDLETQLTERSAALAKAKTDLETQLTERSAALAKVKTDLEAQLTERSAALKNQTTETAQLKDIIAALQTNVDEAARKNAQLTQELADVRAELQQTGSVPDAAKARIQELTQELQDVKTRVETQQRMQTEYPQLQQEVSACHAQAAELTKTQERAQTLQTQLQEAQLAFEKARKELDFTIRQSTKEVAVGMDQAKKELTGVTAQNLDLKKQLDNEIALRKSQEQKWQETTARNTELEKKYSAGLQEVQLKEQLLQQTLTEKALLEQKFEQGSSPYKTIQTQLEQAEAKNAILQEQLAALRKTPGLSGATPPETISVSAGPQEQILRQQSERDLLAARNQNQLLQQQITALSAQLASRQPPAAPPAGAEGRPGSLRALFPPELFQRAAEGALTILGWSPSRTKLAYQESTPQAERLWIFNTQTRQALKLTEWAAPASAPTALAQLAWAADNEHFLAVTGVPGKYLLTLGNSAGLMGNPIPLNEQEVCFAWSPTQLQFAYFSGANLMLQNVKGAVLPLQLNRQPNTPGTALQWSPNGTMIAFSMKRDASVDIFTLKLAEGEPVLQTLVASPSDDLRPAWSPDGKNVAFYVHAENYDTKLAVTPADRSRPPFIVAHNISLPLFGGPQWVTNTELLYVGEERVAVSQNSIYLVDIGTGRRSAAPMSVLLAN